MDGDLFNAGEAVHPIAAKFPMLSEAELAELADDIKANGLQHPIVRSVDGATIIDGRNRLAACRLAGVEPTFDDRIENEDQARALILSENVLRRNITPTMRAMSIAVLYPEPARTAPGRRAETSFVAKDVPSGTLAKARAVLRYAADLADAVMLGDAMLDPAYDQATALDRARKRKDEARRRLREMAPELVARVDAGELTLDEARTLWEASQREERERRRLTFQMLAEYLARAAMVAEAGYLDHLPDWLQADIWDDAHTYFRAGARDIAGQAEAVAAAAAAFAALVRKLEMADGRNSKRTAKA